MTPGIEVRDLSFSHGTHPFMQEVNIAVREGSFTVLLGKNGSGKSTLVRIIAGLLPTQRGTVRVLGIDVGELTVAGRAKIIGYLPQFHSPVFPFTVEEVVLTGRSPYVMFIPKPRDREKAREAIERLGISHLMARPYTELSGGERQLVMIARVVAQEAKVILLDEPISHLDLANQMRILTVLREMTSGGNTVLAVLHDPNIAFLTADHFLFMKDGRVRAPADGENPWDAGVLGDVYGLTVEAIPFRGRSLVVPAG